MSNVAAGVRIGWKHVPSRVQSGVQTLLGDEVVEAVSQVGGFSPGTADRVRTAGGRRAFVKAVGIELSEHSVSLHRQEGGITAALPSVAPVPKLLGVYDDGDWVALVLEDIEGRHPATPWKSSELAAVTGVLRALASGLTPAPPLDVPTTAETLVDDFAGWSRIAQDPPANLDPRVAEQLNALAALAGRGLEAVQGDTLVHGDIRADNLLLTADGGVAVVDWPWATRGAAWLDGLDLLINVQLFGGHDMDSLLAELAASHAAAPDDLISVLAGFAGFLLDISRRPAPPGLPTVRAFQKAQADAVLDWLLGRLPDL